MIKILQKILGIDKLLIRLEEAESKITTLTSYRYKTINHQIETKMDNLFHPNGQKLLHIADRTFYWKDNPENKTAFMNLVEEVYKNISHSFEYKAKKQVMTEEFIDEIIDRINRKQIKGN